MGKIKQWSVEKKNDVERILINMWATIGMEIPSNFEDIVQDCYEDVCETADLEKWSDDDVIIAFRRWIEKQGVPKNKTNSNYFNIASQGWNKGLQREEIQVYCGKNGNLMIIKTNEGFVVDVYDVKGEKINTMTVWEEDINSNDKDDV